MSTQASNLTKKHQVFVAEYLACLDSAQAARKAGYSKRTAQSQGCQLLKHPKIAAEIAKQTGKRLNRLEITADSVLNGIAQLAYYDPRKFFNEDGSAKQVTELDDDTVMALSGFEVEEVFSGRGENRQKVGEIKKFKIADRGINLERLGRHLKLFTEKIEVSGDAELIARLMAGRKRLASE